MVAARCLRSCRSAAQFKSARPLRKTNVAAYIRYSSTDGCNSSSSMPDKTVTAAANLATTVDATLDPTHSSARELPSSPPNSYQRGDQRSSDIALLRVGGLILSSRRNDSRRPNVTGVISDCSDPSNCVSMAPRPKKNLIGGSSSSRIIAYCPSFERTCRRMFERLWSGVDFYEPHFRAVAPTIFSQTTAS